MLQASAATRNDRMEPTSLQAAEAPERWHALDAVRAFALLLGIWLHATLSFLPGGYFVIEDTSHSSLLQGIFYVIHVFRMSLFFLIAGFFARMLRERRGTAGFIKDRSLRIGLTGVLGWVLCLALIHCVYAWAVEKRYGPQVTLDMLGWPYFWLTHLWFLYYLLWIYAAALAMRALWVSVDRNARARGVIDALLARVVRSHLAPLVGAIPMAITFYLIQDWWAWGGIPTPDHFVSPQPSALFGYGVPFAIGWLLHRQPELLRVWEQRWLPYLMVAIFCVWLSHFLVDDLRAPLDDGVDKALCALSYALATWTAMLAVLALGLRFFARPSPARRYLADASYWLYIAHVPLVFALQTAVMRSRLSWIPKFSFILLATVSVLLLIYHYAIRSTWAGTLINGRRHPRTPLSALWQRTNTPQDGSVSA